MNIIHCKSDSKRKRGLSLSSGQDVNLTLPLTNVVYERDPSQRQINTDRMPRQNVHFEYSNPPVENQRWNINNVVRFENRNILQTPPKTAIREIHRPASLSMLQVVNNNQEQFKRQIFDQEITIRLLRDNDKIQKDTINRLSQEVIDIKAKYEQVLKENINFKKQRQDEMDKVLKENQTLRQTLLTHIDQKNNKQNAGSASKPKRANFDKMSEIEAKLNHLIAEIKK